MAKEQSLAIGLDLGTGGARAVALDFSGQLVAEGRAQLPASATRVDGPCVVTVHGKDRKFLFLILPFAFVKATEGVDLRGLIP